MPRVPVFNARSLVSGFVMFAQALARAMDSRLHCRLIDRQELTHLRRAAALLNQREDDSLLWIQLRQGISQRIEFLGVDRTRRLGDLGVLGKESGENRPHFSSTKLIQARVLGHAEEPGLELLRFAQRIEQAHHLDENGLAQILHIIAWRHDGIDKRGDSLLVGEHEFALGRLVARLRRAHTFRQRFPRKGWHIPGPLDSSRRLREIKTACYSAFHAYQITFEVGIASSELVKR
jgi:hypothetical protein